MTKIFPAIARDAFDRFNNAPIQDRIMGIAGGKGGAGKGFTVNSPLGVLHKLTKDKRFPTASPNDIRRAVFSNKGKVRFKVQPNKGDEFDLLKKSPQSKSVTTTDVQRVLTSPTPKSIVGVEKAPKFLKLSTEPTTPKGQIGVATQFENAIERLKSSRFSSRINTINEKIADRNIKRGPKKKGGEGGLLDFQTRKDIAKRAKEKAVLDTDEARTAIKSNVREFQRLTGASKRDAIRQIQRILQIGNQF
jgi:hypothetical protein